VTAYTTWMRLLANTMRKWPMSHTQRSPARQRATSNEQRATSNGQISFGRGGYLRWRIGLTSWRDGMDRPGAHGVNSLSGRRGYAVHQCAIVVRCWDTFTRDSRQYASVFRVLQMLRSRSETSALPVPSVQEVYPVRTGAVFYRPCCFGGERGPPISRMTRIRVAPVRKLRVVLCYPHGGQA